MQLYRNTERNCMHKEIREESEMKEKESEKKENNRDPDVVQPYSTLHMNEHDAYSYSVFSIEKIDRLIESCRIVDSQAFEDVCLSLDWVPKNSETKRSNDEKENNNDSLSKCSQKKSKLELINGKFKL